VVRSPFDLMASADFLVPDRDAAVAMVQRVVGFGEPKPRWSWGAPGQGFRVTFCRPHRTLRQSPTLVELIEPAPVDPARPMSDVVWNVAGLAARQGDRPLKTHGAPVASSAVDDLIERVRSLGYPDRGPRPRREGRRSPGARHALHPGADRVRASRRRAARRSRRDSRMPLRVRRNERIAQASLAGPG